MKDISVPELLKNHNIAISDIGLLKIDTDGHDADCIFSLGENINNLQFVLFWENLIHNNEESERLSELVIWLQKSGYDFFYVFDNFGNFLTRGNGETVRFINDYLLRIRKGYSPGMNYTDILACKKENSTIVENAIYKYLERFC